VTKFGSKVTTYLSPAITNFLQNDMDPSKLHRRLVLWPCDLHSPYRWKFTTCSTQIFFFLIRRQNNYGMPFTWPPPIIDSEEEYKIKNILNARCHGRGCKLQYLVHWRGYPHSNDSWIDHKDLHTPNALSDFYLSNPAAAGGPTV